MPVRERAADRVGTVEWNRRQWSRPEEWPEGGDEWTFHAGWCGQPYGAWKAAVVERFITPYLGPDTDVVEIGPGGGRWSASFAGACRSLSLVDLSEACLDVCRRRFGPLPGLRLMRTDGRSLPVPDASCDLVWSFGVLVHCEPAVVAAYLDETARVLRPGGRFVLHHTGWPDATLRLVPVTRHLGRIGRVAQHRVAQGRWRPGGNRVEMSAERFATLAAAAGLVVEEQVRRWGPDGRYGLAFRDVITLGGRPMAAPAGRPGARGSPPGR